MTTSCYNLFWLGLTNPPSEAETPASFQAVIGGTLSPVPFSPRYLRNIEDIAQNNPNTDIILWVDECKTAHLENLEQWASEASERHEGRISIRYLRRDLEIYALSKPLIIDSGNAAKNYDRNLYGITDAWIEFIVNLTAFPAYRDEPLFQHNEENPQWRQNQFSVIWQQIDALKILLLLATLNEYDVTAFSDLDKTGLIIGEDPVLPKGVRLYTNISGSVENQAFLVSQEGREAMEWLYYHTLDTTRHFTMNGWGPFRELFTKLTKDEPDIGIFIRELGDLFERAAHEPPQRS
ncbi:MAG: hypothetical protein J0L97_04140 [Alphaproteobacteria bacterium]|nr:hypothetical protein [Alphaproteobacteria bacterium]